MSPTLIIFIFLFNNNSFIYKNQFSENTFYVSHRTIIRGIDPLNLAGIPYILKINNSNKKRHIMCLFNDHIYYNTVTSSFLGPLAPSTILKLTC